MRQSRHVTDAEGAAIFRSNPGKQNQRRGDPCRTGEIKLRKCRGQQKSANDGQKSSRPCTGKNLFQRCESFAAIQFRRKRSGARTARPRVLHDGSYPADMRTGRPRSDLNLRRTLRAFNLAAFYLMQTVSLGKSSLKTSRLAFGLWRIAGTPSSTGVPPENRAAARRAIIAAMESGYTLFDNAEVYGGGECERILGDAFKEISGLRERVVLATKCGIRPAGQPNSNSPARYDFSADYILAACNASLKRLRTDVIDLYMLHRPDFLADPDEIAEAFSQLHRAGKVRFFGVSNFRPTLLTALQRSCPMPLVVNQIEISLAKLDAFTDGTLDQCLAEKISPMAWSPLAGGLLGDGAKKLLPAQQTYRPEKFLPVLDAIAQERGVIRPVVALSWLLKHPSKIIPVVGSTNPERIREAAKADELELTRDEWYRLLLAARGEPLP